MRRGFMYRPRLRRITNVTTQVELTKRRAVDLCRVATCLCPLS
jgi:hypothetical protein